MKKDRKSHPEDIKAEIRKKAGSMAKLARQSKVSTSVIRAALIRPQPTGNRLIAEFLGREMHEIWPEWYDMHGNRIPSETAKKPTSGIRVGHCQKRRAA